MIEHILQSVSIDDSCYFGGDALACVLQQIITATGGDAVFGVFTGGVIFIAFYIAGDGDMATPTIALILSGTVLVQMAPPQYQELSIGVVAIGLTAAVWQVIKRYVLSGVAQ